MPSHNGACVFLWGPKRLVYALLDLSCVGKAEKRIFLAQSGMSAPLPAIAADGGVDLQQPKGKVYPCLLNPGPI